ncbi:putative SP-containing protein [Vairimorpha necatrix]|uniref:SP-containing protein n=1 Tax=Vairimorpha necatrix TaxID=6039 RepID=A0AAX4JF02_9MICR
MDCPLFLLLFNTCFNTISLFSFWQTDTEVILYMGLEEDIKVDPLFSFSIIEYAYVEENDGSLKNLVSSYNFSLFEDKDQENLESEYIRFTDISIDVPKNKFFYSKRILKATFKSNKDSLYKIIRKNTIEYSDFFNLNVDTKFKTIKWWGMSIHNRTNHTSLYESTLENTNKHIRLHKESRSTKSLLPYHFKDNTEFFNDLEKTCDTYIFELDKNTDETSDTSVFNLDALQSTSEYNKFLLLPILHNKNIEKKTKEKEKLYNIIKQKIISKFEKTYEISLLAYREIPYVFFVEKGVKKLIRSFSLKKKIKNKK